MTGCVSGSGESDKEWGMCDRVCQGVGRVIRSGGCVTGCVREWEE